MDLYVLALQNNIIQKNKKRSVLLPTFIQDQELNQKRILMIKDNSG